MFDYWDYCNNRDIISPLVSMLQSRECFLREDKIYIPMATGVFSPWVHAQIRDDVNCHRYQTIYHKLFGIIPKNCFRCWKVVQRPNHIGELFEIEKYQKEMRVAAKCGIETRNYVPFNYGAYWYNKTKAEGFERLEIVKRDFPHIQAVLKRGCTEFEMSHGPSTEWRMNEKYIRIEEMLDNVLVEVWRNSGLEEKKLCRKPYPRFVDDNIKRRWVEFAWERGDKMYKLFTQGQPLMVPTIKYEPELETGCEIIGVKDKVKNEL